MLLLHFYQSVDKWLSAIDTSFFDIRFCPSCISYPSGLHLHTLEFPSNLTLQPRKRTLRQDSDSNSFYLFFYFYCGVVALAECFVFLDKSQFVRSVGSCDTCRSVTLNGCLRLRIGHVDINV